MVRIKLALIAIGIAVVLCGLERTLRDFAFLVDYGRRLRGANLTQMFQSTDPENQLMLVGAWSSYLFEPFVGIAFMVFGWWLIRSRSAIRAVVGIRRMAS